MATLVLYQTLHAYGCGMRLAREQEPGCLTGVHLRIFLVLHVKPEICRQGQKPGRPVPAIFARRRRNMRRKTELAALTSEESTSTLPSLLLSAVDDWHSGNAGKELADSTTSRA